MYTYKYYNIVGDLLFERQKEKLPERAFNSIDDYGETHWKKTTFCIDVFDNETGELVQSQHPELLSGKQWETTLRRFRYYSSVRDMGIVEFHKSELYSLIYWGYAGIDVNKAKIVPLLWSQNRH